MTRNNERQPALARLAEGLAGLTVLRGIRKNPAMDRLCSLVRGGADGALSPGEAADAYAGFLSSFYETHTDLGQFLLDLLLADENICLRKRALQEPLSPILERALVRDLGVLSNLASLDSLAFREALGLPPGGPDWTWGRVDLGSAYGAFMDSQPQGGYGLFARTHAFSLGPAVAGGEPGLVPIRHPDYLELSRMYGYRREREEIRRNVEAFLDGQAWQNMLLYGDAGTGKSSTIKAFAKAYAHRGLRIIQISRHQLPRLPELMDYLTSVPLKFILFIDDLTFSSVDDDFTTLKIALEGGLLAQGQNVAIFATTNRRHLVRESFGDRQGDDIHVSEGLQETMGLAGRFGLTVVFGQPGRGEYLAIAEEIAKEKGIEMPMDELVRQAEAYALRKNGRSPRVARQFVDSILQQSLPLPPKPPSEVL